MNNEIISFAVSTLSMLLIRLYHIVNYKNNICTVNELNNMCESLHLCANI